MKIGILTRFAAILLLLGAAAAPACAQDQLKLAGQEPMSVTINKETRDQVDYSEEDSTVTQSPKVDRIEWLYYSDAPSVYKNAMDAYDNKRYARALADFLEAQKSKMTTKNDWMKIYLEYYIPVCAFHAAAENPKDGAKGLAFAVDGLSKFTQTRKDCWLSHNALYYQGRALILQQKYPEAEKAFQELKQGSGMPGYQARAEFGLLLCLKAKGDNDQALKLGLDIMAARRGNADIMEILAEILLDKKKDYPQALKVAEELIKSGGEREHMQKAYEISGCALFRLKKYQKALDDLLRSGLLYTSSSTPTSPRVNLHTALAIKVLMEKEPTQYPAWEYDRILADALQKLGEAERKTVKEFKD